MQETFALVMFQGIEEELLVWPPFTLAVALLHSPLVGRLRGILEVVALGDHNVMALDISDNVLKCQSLGILLAPVVQRRTDRLGCFVARNVVTAVTAELGDGLAPDEPLELVGPGVFLVGGSQPELVG